MFDNQVAYFEHGTRLSVDVGLAQLDDAGADVVDGSLELVAKQRAELFPIWIFGAHLFDVHNDAIDMRKAHVVCLLHQLLQIRLLLQLQ